MANPLDDFLEEYGEKTAFKWGEMGQHAGNALAGAATTAVGAAAVAGVGLSAKHIYDAATAKRDFRGMLEWNKDLHHEDQALVNQSFRTLRRFAPDMSKDPMVAGSMIRQMVQSPQGAAGVIHQAIGAQKNMGTPVMDAYMAAGNKGMADGMRDFEPLGAKPGSVRKSEHEDAMRGAFDEQTDFRAQAKREMAEKDKAHQAGMTAALSYQQDPTWKRLVRRGIIKGPSTP